MEELVYIPGRLVHVCHKAGIHSNGLANQARVETIKIHLHYECFSLFLSGFTVLTVSDRPECQQRKLLLWTENCPK